MPFLTTTKMFYFLGVLMGLFLANPASAAGITGSQIFDQVNAQRVSAHETRIVANAVLVKAAQAKADDMVKLGYFAHVSPSGKNAWDFVGYSHGFQTVGENLAEGFQDAPSTLTAWMASPTHRANILDKSWKWTGIGIAHTATTIYVVQYFGN